jgi:phosphoenolpyruvate carboxykinase (GTP)
MESINRFCLDLPHLFAWIHEVAALCQPDNLYFCKGTPEEFHELTKKLVDLGIFVPLNPRKRPESFWCHSHPDDVARTEEDTFICSRNKEDAGPTNNWCDPEEMRGQLNALFNGCMRGRTLYIVPFSMGNPQSSFFRLGVQITDSPYVVCNLHLMAHLGDPVLKALQKHPFVPCIHSVGVPLSPGEKDLPWPCNLKKRRIVHFPESRAIWSFGSGYGGNALLNKKSFALRIASVMGKEEGWIAAHMLVLGITNPQGKKKYFAAAFPSACGKTNLALLKPTLPGWKIETLGDDIAWLCFNDKGQLCAINPEAGFFGVASGTSFTSNPHAMETISRKTIFTNVALTKDKDVWWEGMSKTPPSHLTDWLSSPWDPASGKPAAHPNSRFTVSIRQCPILDPAWEKGQPVPLSAIIFGGRRKTLIPLVYEAFSWEHGILMGASLSSEMTAAAKGELGKVRYDPFAMLPFCGYHMGDYFQQWLDQAHQTESLQLPSIFHVNWFRTSPTGEWLWPGFGENIRVLKWMFERIDGMEDSAEWSPIGFLPQKNALDLSGLKISESQRHALFEIQKESWLKEMESLNHYFASFGERFPVKLRKELHQLQERLSAYIPK